MCEKSRKSSSSGGGAASCKKMRRINVIVVNESCASNWDENREKISAVIKVIEIHDQPFLYIKNLVS